MIGRLRPSAVGPAAFRSDSMQGQVGASCSARYGAIPWNAVHMASIREHSRVWASAHDVYVTRTLNAVVGIVIDTAGLDLSNSRLRAAASQASSTPLQNSIAGVSARSKQVGSRLYGWRSSLARMTGWHPAREISMGEGTIYYCLIAEDCTFLGCAQQAASRSQK